jgi:hypothetical protein
MGLSARAAGTTPVERPLPEPEDVFLSWLISQPADTDLAVAAGAEINRLRQYRGPNEGPKRLIDLFEALRATLTGAHGRRRGRRPAVAASAPQLC